MEKYKNTLWEMRTFLLLWVTQSFSGLGSAMTSYALVIWSYTQRGSALMTALLMVSSYAPYVLLSIFAGALSDKWNKKITMLVCDTIAALTTVVMVDLFSFATAFLALAFVIRIPENKESTGETEKLLVSARKGIAYLRKERGIFHLILFLAAINLVASIYDAAFPAMMLSRNGGSEKILGLVNAVIGAATLAGSILASFIKEPKSRVRVICNCLLFSMSTENFLLAVGRTPLIWCIGGVLGWIVIPLMSTNLDAIMRLRVPEQMQGRVYSVRNSLQFFTIPIGYFLGGFLVDQIFEPVMAVQREESLLIKMFGAGKGSGAALLFFVLAFAGIGVCLYFRYDKHIWELEQ